MSDSYKKHAFCSYSGHKKDKQIRNRRNRSRLKQYVNTHFDWDSFLLPSEKSFDDPWADFDYYCGCQYRIPALNQCQVDMHDYNHNWHWNYNDAEKYWGFDGEHMKDCRCYSNKRNTWWKAKRK